MSETLEELRARNARNQAARAAKSAALHADTQRKKAEMAAAWSETCKGWKTAFSEIAGLFRKRKSK